MDTESLAHHLRGLEEQLLRPEVRKSAARVAAMLSDEFVEFGSSGRIFNKAQVVEGLSRERPAEWTLWDFQATPLAPGAMLVTYRALRIDAASEPPVHSLRSSIWKLIGGRWQMVFHQGTPTRSE